jgi:hypothetical protein
MEKSNAVAIRSARGCAALFQFDLDTNAAQLFLDRLLTFLRQRLAPQASLTPFRRSSRLERAGVEGIARKT